MFSGSLTAAEIVLSSLTKVSQTHNNLFSAPQNKINKGRGYAGEIEKMSSFSTR